MQSDKFTPSTVVIGDTDAILRVMFPGIENDADRLAEQHRLWLEQKQAEYAARALHVISLVGRSK